MDTPSTMPKYNAYRKSGEDWIGNVPAHWEVKSVKAVLLERIEKNDPIKTNDILSLCMYRGVIPYSEKGASGNKAKEDLTAYRLAYPGDIVLNSMNVIAGSVGLSKFFGAVSPVYYMLRPRKESDHVEFFNEIFQNEAFQKSLIGLGNGILIKKLASSGKLNTIRMKIPMIKLNKVLLPCPPESEQVKILDFLRIKNSQIDDAVAIKVKQIALLRERKQIITEKAVTQGLNPNSSMKDSGADWIGLIPEHWVVKRAKYLFEEVDERSKTGKEELLSVSHITGVTPRSEKNVTMIAEDYTGSKTCQKNDLIINIMWAWMGALGVSDRDGIVSSAYSIFRQKPFHTFNPVYLEWLLKTRGYIEHYNKVSTGLHSSRLRFYSRMFFDMEMGFPNLEEQDEIVQHIENQSVKIDEAIELQNLQVVKLKEYKTTLINSAVTGKIKML